MIKLIAQMGQSKVVLVFIVLLGLIIGYLSYSQSREPLVIVGPSDSGADSIELFRELYLDFSILDDPDFKALEIFGESPVDPGVTGERKDPFASI